MKKILRISKSGDSYEAFDVELRLIQYINTDWQEFIQSVIQEADIIYVDDSIREKKE